MFFASAANTYKRKHMISEVVIKLAGSTATPGRLSSYRLDQGNTFYAIGGACASSQLLVEFPGTNKHMDTSTG